MNTHNKIRSQFINIIICIVHNNDNIYLMFSVKDLMSLLKTTDFQFYREASEIHSELRRVNTKQMIFSSLLATTLYATFSGAPLDINRSHEPK